jgi:hypothetical protein
MQFLKKHYEKIVLSVVLLCLAVAAALLPLKVSEAQQKVKDTQDSILNPPKIKERPPVDLSTNAIWLARSAKASALDFAFPHYLFNPLAWQRKADGSVVKPRSLELVGAAAVSVVSITPLHLEVTYVGTTGSEDTLRYQVSVVRETGGNSRTRNHLSKANDRNENFALREIRGPKDDPTALVVELQDDKRTVTLEKEKPFRKGIGFVADLRYEPENRTYSRVKEDGRLVLSREVYKIIEINETEVVLSHESTGKRTIVPHQRAAKP